MLTIKQGIKLSAIIDKLEIKISDPKGDQAKVGADIMMQFVSKAHKAENEIYAFIASVKNISAKDAESVDLIEFIKEIANDTGIQSFFKSAVK